MSDQNSGKAPPGIQQLLPFADAAAIRRQDADIELDDASFVSPKIAIGRAYVIENERIEPSAEEKALEFGKTEAELDAMDAEAREEHCTNFVTRQKRRVLIAMDRTAHIYQKAKDRAEQYPMLETIDTLSLHLTSGILMGQDPSARQEIGERIEKGESAEVALDGYFEQMIQILSMSAVETSRRYVSEAAEARAVMQHELHPDKTTSTEEKITDGNIIVTKDLLLRAIPYFTDPETGKLLVRGVLSETGGIVSHGAIISKSMGTAYAHVDIADIKTGDVLIMDPKKGVVYVNPSDELIEKYEGWVHDQKEVIAKLHAKWDGKREVHGVDGNKVNIHANVNASFESAEVRKNDPVGVGLLRTEMAQKLRVQDDVSVNQWLRISKGYMEICAPEHRKSGLMGITFRSIDLAGDKSDAGEEERRRMVEKNTANQFMAWVKLKHELKATNNDTKLRVMVPQVSTLMDMDSWQGTMDLQAEMASEELGEEVESIKLGAMVETVEILDHLDELDASFMSIGSNDLTYEVLKAHYQKLWKEQPDVQHPHKPEDFDRYGKEADDAYDPTHPAVLGAIRKVVETCKERGIPFSICGAMASDPKYHIVLRGLGLRNMSVDADSIPLMKETASRTNDKKAAEFVRRLEAIDNKERREHLLAEVNKEKIGLHNDGSIDLAWDPPEPAALVID